MVDIYALNPPEVLAALEEKPKKRQKYNARRIVQDGHKFDSAVEHRRYVWLLGLEEREVIHGLKVHYRMELIPKFKSAAGTCHRSVTFTPDFMYTNAEGRTVFEDVKGMERTTADFEVRRKLLQYQHQDAVFMVVREDKDTGAWDEVVY